MPDDREPLGRIAHGIYRDWLTEQVQRVYGDAERSSWEDLTEGMREAYMRMGSAVAARAVADAQLGADRMRVQVVVAASERDRVIRELQRRADRARPGPEQGAWLAAAEIVRGAGHQQERSEGGDGGH